MISSNAIPKLLCITFLITVTDNLYLNAMDPMQVDATNNMTLTNKELSSRIALMDTLDLQSYQYFSYHLPADIIKYILFLDEIISPILENALKKNPSGLFWSIRWLSAKCTSNRSVFLLNTCLKHIGTSLREINDQYGKNILHYALKPDFSKCIEIILNIDQELAFMPSKEGDSAWISIMMEGLQDVLKIFTGITKDPEFIQRLILSKNNHGNTALHCVVVNGYKNLVETLLEITQNFEIVSMLLLAQNNDGNTALHLAYLNPSHNRNQDEILQLLLKKAENHGIKDELFDLKNCLGRRPFN